ncbi:MAG: DUF2391 family protein [Nanoarchaeota archaeon]|nr:DUF2391 family protein [Nanoarchaeota archaeon]MBU1704548.1 DUF2391 family protein [Nanoarchaeota archaeon]
MKGDTIKKSTIKIDGHIHEVTTIHDKKGNLIHRIINRLHMEVGAKDLMEIIVGAAILAIPVGFTEETWRLGEMLPLINIVGLGAMSIFFITSFVYYTYYRGHMKGNVGNFANRVLSTYILSFIVIAGILSLIQITPWLTDPLLAVKRTVIVTVPASMTAAVADVIK